MQFAVSLFSKIICMLYT